LVIHFITIINIINLTGGACLLFEHMCYACMVQIWWYFTRLYGFCKYSQKANILNKQFRYAFTW
jgi:hypothetical protein